MIPDKVVALISSDPKIKELCGRLESRIEFTKKRVENIHKQCDEAQEQLVKDNAPDWKELEAYLKEQGVLEEYNSATQNLRFDIKRNCIVIDSKEKKNPLHDLLRGLFH